MQEAYLTVTEAANRLRLNPETVRIHLRTGRLRGVRMGGTRAGWRVPESEVARALTDGMATTNVPERP